MEDKITPTDLKQEAQRLIADGKMPPLEVLLKAVSDTRDKYRKQLDEE